MTYEKRSLQNPQTSTLAIISLIGGILSVICLILLCVPCLRFLAIIFGLASAIMGFISLRQIKNSDGALTGRGMAITGLIAGLISFIGVIVLMIIGIGLSIPVFLLPLLSGEYY